MTTRRPARVRAALAAVALIAVVASACSSEDDSSRSSGDAKATTTTAAATTTTTAIKAAGTTSLVLDPTHDYGNLYANGILPVGDSQYVTDTPKQGWVFLCRAPQGNAGGAQARGPWFSADGTTYDINQKVAVEGNGRMGRLVLRTGERRQASRHHERPAPRPHHGRIPGVVVGPGVRLRPQPQPHRRPVTHLHADGGSGRGRQRRVVWAAKPA